VEGSENAVAGGVVVGEGEGEGTASGREGVDGSVLRERRRGIWSECGRDETKKVRRERRKTREEREKARTTHLVRELGQTSFPDRRQELQHDRNSPQVAHQTREAAQYIVEPPQRRLSPSLTSLIDASEENLPDLLVRLRVERMRGDLLRKVVRVGRKDFVPDGFERVGESGFAS
jgi:hypothetical protein